MKKYISTILLVLTIKILTSQDNGDSYLTRPLDGISLNLLGDASLISIQFDKLFPINKNLFITSKLGLGYSSEIFDQGSNFTIPFHLTTIVGRNRGFVEVGPGATLSFGDRLAFISYVTFGYRLQPLKAQKINFRIFVQLPVIYSSDAPYFFPIGISMGTSF